MVLAESRALCKGYTAVTVQKLFIGLQQPTLSLQASAAHAEEPLPALLVPEGQSCLVQATVLCWQCVVPSAEGSHAFILLPACSRLLAAAMKHCNLSSLLLASMVACPVSHTGLPSHCSMKHLVALRLAGLLTRCSRYMLFASWNSKLSMLLMATTALSLVIQRASWLCLLSSVVSAACAQGQQVVCSHVSAAGGRYHLLC